MSLEAYIWAANLPLSRCNGTPFRVLLQLADRADKLGYGAYPHVSTIAETLECSDRTVQRAIRELIRDGLIRSGDQRFVDHLDPRYRPTVYDVLTAALIYSESRGDNRVTPARFRGDKSGHSGVTTVVAQRTVQEPSYQDSPRHLTLVTAREAEGSDLGLGGRSSGGASLNPSQSTSVLIESRQDRTSDDEVHHQQSDRNSEDGQQEREPNRVVVVHGPQRSGVSA